MATKKKTPKKSPVKKGAASSAFVLKKSADGRDRWVHVDPKERHKKMGNPIVAFRAPGDLVRAFVKKHKNSGKAHHALKLYMARVTGVPLVLTGEE